MNEPFVLVLYYSRHGATYEMARIIAQGIEQVEGIAAKVKTVPPVSTDPIAPLTEPETGPGFVTKQDLMDCSGIVLGSPTRFGNMAAPLKYFLDSTSDIWLSGGLINKPAGAFTSSSSMHGGQETTLLTMLLPLMHHGAYIVGVPYSEAALNKTSTGGTPYGPSHVAGSNHSHSISPDEKQICLCLGKRIATLAATIHNP